MDAPHWFTARFPHATAVQRPSWPVIMQGDNLLLSAPTGSGKTLAAMLPIMHHLVAEPSAELRCLYVVPLKSLANDVQKNLASFLADIPADGVRVAVRTGDTPAHERRKLYEAPPAILITTPESLAILLTHPAAVSVFTSLRWIVIDEIHAVIPNKRGADLAISLERLETLVEKPLQRIGLSATFAPLAEAARYLVGGDRSCQVVHIEGKRDIELMLEPLSSPHPCPSLPEGEGAAVKGSGFLARVIRRLERELQSSRTTLIFTDVRSLAEQLTWRLRRHYPEWRDQISAHHSSLSLDRRRDIEGRLKNGELRIVVSSASLELGIDIGAIDTVALLHAPRSVTRLLQRIGRAGHCPNGTGRALILTANANELLEAALTIASGVASQIEMTRLPRHPLDVLCQQILGMAVQQPTSPEAAFALVKRAYPYRDLPRAEFDDCLAYLFGKDRAGRDWLPPRLRWEADRFVIADRRTTRIVRSNLGSIISEDDRAVRLEISGDLPLSPRRRGEGVRGAEIGRVDNDFAERLQPGDRFVLDGRCLEYRQAEGADLLVTEVVGYPLTPRWGGSLWTMPAELAQRIFVFRAQAGEALREGKACLKDMLARDLGMRGAAGEDLADLFDRQDSLSEIPDLAVCLIEALAGADEVHYFLHTPLNRAGNSALGRVLAQRLSSGERGRVDGMSEWVAADLGLLLTMRGEIATERWRELLDAAKFDADLDTAIASSSGLRERFARVASTGMMILRNPLGRKRRVGGRTYLQQRLFEQLHAVDPDFVLLRQARREMREECCDAEHARAYLQALPRCAIRVRWLATASPFAENWLEPIMNRPEFPSPYPLPQETAENVLVCDKTNIE